MEEKTPFSTLPVLSKPKRIVLGIVSSAVALSILFFVSYLLETYKRQALKEMEKYPKVQVVRKKKGKKAGKPAPVKRKK